MAETHGGCNRIENASVVYAHGGPTVIFEKLIGLVLGYRKILNFGRIDLHIFISFQRIYLLFNRQRVQLIFVHPWPGFA